MRALTKENRFSTGPIPASTDEKVVKVKDGIVVEKEVNGKIFLRKRNIMSQVWFWEEEGTPGCCSPSTERYWCM